MYVCTYVHTMEYSVDTYVHSITVQHFLEYRKKYTKPCELDNMTPQVAQGVQNKKIVIFNMLFWSLQEDAGSQRYSKSKIRSYTRQNPTHYITHTWYPTDCPGVIACG